MKIWKDIVRIWRVGLYEAKIIILSLKFVILSAVSWMFIDLFVMEIRKFALDYNLRMVPACLPFYFADLVSGNIALLLLVFLFSDMPLKDSSQKQILQRSGIGCYAGGQLLAVVLVTVVYVIEQFIFSVLCCLPCIEFSGWGKVWGSVASNTFGDLGYHTYSGVSEKILSVYLPWQAILASSFLFALTGICYGMLGYLLNGVSKGKAGTVVLSVWSLAWIILQGMQENWVHLLNRYSPQGWNNLADRNMSGVVKMAGWLILYLIIFWGINVVLSRKRKIEVV